MKKLITSFFKEPLILIEFEGNDFKFNLEAPPLFQFVLFIAAIKLVIYLISLIS